VQWLKSISIAFWRNSGNTLAVTAITFMSRSSAIPQLYAEIGAHDVIFRVGYAIGLQGFEASQARTWPPRSRRALRVGARGVRNVG
jgi:hypothetical protein